MNKTRLASLADSLSVKVMLLFLVFQVAFVLSNTAANCLPRPVIESHAQGSESSALLTHMTQSAVKSHNGPADRLQSVGGACR